MDTAGKAKERMDNLKKQRAVAVLAAYLDEINTLEINLQEAKEEYEDVAAWSVAKLANVFDTDVHQDYMEDK
jgi:hypothetical protein